MGLMTRRLLLLMTLWLAAAGARAEPREDDGVLDPWAPVDTSQAASWSPPAIALIVNPWGERVAHRVKSPPPRLSAVAFDQIVDPWRSSTDAGRTPRFRNKSSPYPSLLEIVDPWADRPTVASAAFPAEGVVDPWQSRAVDAPGSPAR